jgi:two-component system CheB/CheR fusion protein
MKPQQDLIQEVKDLRGQLQDAQDTLEAIREGAVDALVVSGSSGEKCIPLPTQIALIDFCSRK